MAPSNWLDVPSEEQKCRSLGLLLQQQQQTADDDGAAPARPRTDGTQQQQQKPATTVTVRPQTGYVLKTRNERRADRYEAGLKVFVNICWSDDVPGPAGGIDRSTTRVVAELLRRGGHWEIPCCVGVVRWETDRTGRQCVAVDCCVNARVYEAALDVHEIKALLIETAFELVENRTAMDLSREFSLPKMRSKGVLETIELSGRPGPATPDNDVTEIGGVRLAPSAQRTPPARTRPLIEMVS